MICVISHNLRRDKALVSLDKLLDQLDHGLSVEGRKSNSLGRSVEACHVPIGSE